MTADRTVIVDRAQRRALRRELGVYAHRAEDLEAHFDAGDRAGFMRAFAMVRDVAMVMDAIGWQESADAPELVQIVVDDQLAAWAAPAADGLAHDLADDIPVDVDSDLDALGALRLIAGGA